MRSSTIFALALSALGVSAVAVGSQSSQPACVTKCWANSQYVSNCAGNQKCLCDDAEFQNAMYQCLYSQCQTAQFGVALHHALALCSEEQVEAPSSTVPALLRQGDLRKRQYATQSASVTFTRTTLTRTDTRTVTATRGSASVSASAYMTYSTSRASPTSSSVILTVPSSTVPAPMSYTVTLITESIVVSPAPMTSTVSPVSVVTQISDGQIQAPATPLPLMNRELWDEQRYPAA